MVKVRLLRVAVHLQADFLVGVFELRRRDQVVPLDVGQVVHGLRVPPAPLGLPVDVPHGQAHHAQQHQQRHQAHRQRHRRPLEAIGVVAVAPHGEGHGGGGGQELAVGPREAHGADAGGGGLAGTPSAGAEAAVGAGPQGALVQQAVAVAPGVARGTCALVVVDVVQAGAAVDAGVVGTLVGVDLAALAREARSAAAHTGAAVDDAESACGENKDGKVRCGPDTLSNFSKVIKIASAIA